MQFELIIFAVIAGGLKIATPLLLAAVGDCLTQRCGRLNLGIEGIIPCATVAAVWVAHTSSSALAGLLAALLVGCVLAVVHWACCLLPKVNDLAAGIALLVLGIGLARFAGSDLIAVVPATLPQINLFNITFSWLLPIGLISALVLGWLMHATRGGLLLKAVATDEEAVKLLAFRPQIIKLVGTIAGGIGSGTAGAALGLAYPLGWSAHIADNIGITAVALVFIAGSQPLMAAGIALVFGFTAALGPAIQAVSGTEGYHLLNVMPFLLTIVLLVWSARGKLQLGKSQ